MRSEQRLHFFEEFVIVAALPTQELVLLLDRQSQRRLEQFIDSFPSLSVHRNFRNLSRGAARPEQYSSRAPP